MKRTQKITKPSCMDGKRKVFKKFPKTLAIIGACLGAALLSQTVLANSECKTDKIPEYVDINVQAACPDMEGLKKDKKKVLHFSHKAHIDMMSKSGEKFVCATCHKTATSEKDIFETDKCERLKKELDKDGGAGKLKNHFHGMCVKCHKTLKKAGKQTGPTSCKGCHNRKGGK